MKSKRKMTERHPLETMLRQGRHHPGYVIGCHWMTAAYARICAGEGEIEVMDDYGWTYLPVVKMKPAFRAKLARARLGRSKP